MLDKIEWIRRPAVSDDEVTKMLDIKLIRENPDKIKAGLKAKEVDCDELIDRILELDEQRRTLLQQTEALKAEQNKVSKQIPALKKAGEDTTAIFKEMGEIKAKISELDGQLREVMNEYQQDLYCLPNMPDDDLLPGGKLRELTCCQTTLIFKHVRRHDHLISISQMCINEVIQ